MSRLSWLIVTFTVLSGFHVKANENSLIEKYNSENLGLFSRTIFLGARGEEYEAPNYDFKLELVYNQDGYSEGVSLPPPGKLPRSGNIIKVGHPISLNRDAPIGYNIMIPQDKEIKAVFVLVYGGYQKTERKEKMIKPGPPDRLSLSLLDKGIAVVTLNLVDLLKLEINQWVMPEALHTELHASINKFFETLKNDPKSIDPDLDKLKGKKIFLYGGSFGGRGAIRQAELYPKTFSGYISHDGAISAQFAEDRNAAIEWRSERRYPANEKWLIPMTEDPKSDDKINRLQDPVLLLHNLDDHRVSVQATLRFYEKAQRVGKGSLVRLHITKLGDPMGADEPDLKGHGLPNEKEAYEDYIQMLSSFILKGPSSVPAKSEWQAHKTNLAANQFAFSATIEERFLSFAYRLFKDADRLNPKGEASTFLIKNHQDEVWKKYYSPLLYIIGYVDDLKKDPEKLKNVAIYLKGKGVLTPVVLENGLKQQLPDLLPFLKEKESFQLPASENIGGLAKDKDLQSKYYSFLTTGSCFGSECATYLLLTLYQGNMEQTAKGLIEPAAYHAEVEKWSGKLNGLKTQFIQNLEKESALIKKTFQQGVNAVIKENRK
jgi:hypothetical protein